jgi:putative ABC transport system ATP-binding protein
MFFSMSNAALAVEGLTKIYHPAGEALTVLADVSFTLEAGSTCAVWGPSGSGKSTLLSLCAGLDSPTAGTVRLDGQNLNELDEEGRAQLRLEQMGFVFQNFQLLPNLTALENVMVPLELLGRSGERARAEGLLDSVGLGSRLQHYPAELSGGEQQRVALARGFVQEPRILFADEPTGNLDLENSTRVVEMLFRLNAEHGTVLMLVTHDEELARRTGKILRLKGGRLG